MSTSPANGLSARQRAVLFAADYSWRSAAELATRMHGTSATTRGVTATAQSLVRKGLLVQNAFPQGAVYQWSELGATAWRHSKAAAR